ncbi:MAG: hypothetical protein GYA18_07460 [Chloroflexi bacterium]|nr:hypothetical protein [Chloroflexota bacterium]
MIRRRERIRGKPDQGLLNSLKSGDQNALALAMAMKNKPALAAVEETIALYAGNPQITFFQPGGLFVKDTLTTNDAVDELERLVNTNQLLTDPAYSQYCISRLGREVGNIFLQELYRTNSQACYDYQLLGIHMQLVILIDKLI